jgi:hypothetical protein
MSWIVLSLVAMAVVGVLGLRLVPRRWNSIDLTVRPWGLTVSADSDPDEPE